MSGLVMKLIACPAVLLLSNYLFPRVLLNYPRLYQPILTGLVLAVMAHMMELVVLRKGTFWMSNILDFGAAFAIVYLTQFVLAGAVVTGAGALFAALLLSITEYFQHLWLIKNNKVKRL